MKKITINRSTLLTAIVMLMLGLLIGWLIKPSASGSDNHEAHQTERAASTEATEWTCSMHPQIRRPEPGQCPICGMDLIPLEDDMPEQNPMEIGMSPTAMQLANIQTAIVGRGAPVKEVRMNGKVQPDERLVFSQVTHLAGRVEELAVNFTGEPVKKGQKLASIYSPELVTAQEELFSAMRIKDMQPALFAAAKEKLRNWKLTEQQVENIIAAGKPQERFPILADVSGIVMEKKVKPGDYLMRGMPLYDIVDLSRVWVLFDVYESDMPWMKVGSTVSFTIQSLPGESFNGRVAFIDPAIDPASRVASARVEVANPGGKLKPEMFASGIVKTRLESQGESLMAPRSAVLWTGERSVVYVKRAGGQGVSFLMREITLGPLVGDSYVVKEGLEPGEEIAVNGAFSIDAAAQLAGKPSMMNPPGGAANTGHQHGGVATEGAVAISQETKAAIRKLFGIYFALKDALVKGDSAAAARQARALKTAFEKTEMSLFSGPAHDHWMNHSRTAAESLKKLADTKDVDEARRHFKPLSGQMVALAKAFGPFGGETIYVQHCPMADDNAGADWLSLDREIRNPYFGNKMLKCGSVTETIQ